MPSLTGTAGGRNGSAIYQEEPQFFRSLLTGEIRTSALDAHIRAYPKPVKVSMAVGNFNQGKI